MNNLIPVKGHPNLYRDRTTGAILNYDNMDYNQYVISLNKRENDRKEIDNMKQDIEEIKSLLKEVIDKFNQ